MSACSFTMQTFNHNNYYIVMERGKFLYYATFLTIILSCLHAPSLCRLLTTIIIILSWNVASSSTMPLFDNYFVMSACSFIMQTFNHNNYYIVMERGKFLYYATFLAIILSCLHAPSLCRLLTTTIIILSWNVASSSTMPLF